jgi:two-component system OmpR family response regulator
MGELIMDLQKHSVTRLGSTIQLDPKEFALLEFFLRHPNEVFSIDVLRQKVWRSERIGVNAVRTCINRLREKIDMGCQHSIIETVHRVGYRLCGTETDME